MLAATALGFLCSACGGGWDRIAARGEIGGHSIDTTVDSPIARYYLQRHAAGDPHDPTLERTLRQVLEPVTATPPAAADLARLSAATSPDLATLHLVRILSSIPENAALEQVFRAHLERVRGMAGDDLGPLGRCVTALELPPVWFVPGWFYETQPGTGANFFRQRLLLERLGVENRLVPLIENGTVEQNARILAREIRQLASDDAIILVSASKGGPEAAHALGALLTAEEARPVKAWINIGGLLRGSPLADFARSWPIRWLAPLYFWHQGRDPGDSVESLTTERSRARFARETIPEHVALINFAGIPLSGDVSSAAEFGYTRMREGGPNDGLTLIVDELAHGGRTIVQMGLDHYYRDPELDLKTVALALTVITDFGHPLPAACRARSDAPSG